MIHFHYGLAVGWAFLPDLRLRRISKGRNAHRTTGIGQHHVILNELKLNKFCIYRGEHEFNLAPSASRGKTKPVVLFGGMNSGGKTTILNAVQWVLYGKRSKCSKRGEKSYEDFLRGCIGSPAASDY